uniref:Angiopoietin like 4 n=1 Tax=Eptatretus burgeri TaxID=7764 RepID=A0A8C4N2V4_EPTBU
RRQLLSVSVNEFLCQATDLLISYNEHQTVTLQIAKNKGSIRENIDILSHGVLQLGTALRHVAERTTRQVSEALGRLKLAGTRLETIAGRAQNLREAQMALQKRASRLEEKEMQQSRESAELKTRMHRVAKEKAKLEERLLRLEQQSMHKAHVGSLDIRKLRVRPHAGIIMWRELLIILWYGGWTVFQHRIDGSVSFDQDWESYRNGFGNLTGNHWIGLEQMFHLTKLGPMILRVEIDDWNGENQSIQHANFSLGGGNEAYRLHLGPQVSGEIKSAMITQSGAAFSTRDRDHDSKVNGNCAEIHSGGWWFSDCGDASLNGVLLNEQRGSGRKWRCRGMLWKPWTGRKHIIRTTTMMLRPMDQIAEAQSRVTVG